MHYVPNNSARDLVKPQADAIGAVVRGVGNPFFTEVIRSLEAAIVSAGYSMIFHQIRSGEDELCAGAALAQSKRLRGLILLDIIQGRAGNCHMLLPTTLRPGESI